MGPRGLATCTFAMPFKRGSSGRMGVPFPEKRGGQGCKYTSQLDESGVRRRGVVAWEEMG